MKLDELEKLVDVALRAISAARDNCHWIDHDEIIDDFATAMNPVTAKALIKVVRAAKDLEQSHRVTDEELCANSDEYVIYKEEALKHALKGLEK